MILIISYDVRRRGGIERLSLHVQACLEQQGERVELLYAQRLGPGSLGRQLGRLWFLLQLSWWLPKARQVLCMHALLLRPLSWLELLRPQRQPLQCWLHGIEELAHGLPVAADLFSGLASLIFIAVVGVLAGGLLVGAHSLWVRMSAFRSAR